MKFADAKEIQAQVVAHRKTHWVLRLITPTTDEYRTMPKDNPNRKIFGAFDPEFLDGATVYAAGAVDPEKSREVIAVPSPAWKGRK